MSQLLINSYLKRLSVLRQITGGDRETQVRAAFQRLLEDWGESKKLTFVAEYDYLGPARNVCRVDGVLLQSLRAPFGWWEAKDSKDDLQEEITKKLRKGYPQDNIIFEDGRQAVLIQNRRQLEPVSTTDPEALGAMLRQFFNYEPETSRRFRKAVDQFKTDLPAVLHELRGRIVTAYADNPAFVEGARAFLAHAKETINPAIVDDDVREMLIQHILTEDIFARVFNDGEFHRENNVARELYKLEHLFFRGEVRKATLAALEPYYAEINATSAQIASHGEKQRFLKAIYEDFYKVYNPKAADRLGVVYTPAEIVRFMVESTDWLCQRHFGRSLIDREVQILDPATGTGTFIVELMEHFRGQPEKLAHKYREELNANEVAILPYYVANLNIEATYAAITGKYEEFTGLCFVDTLDNVAALKLGRTTGDLFGAVSEENIDRIKRQNARRISVVIGNPPYNANQQNENENNKNREYGEIDRRIKETYIKASTAQKTKLYDMYSRFFRWASDRIEEDGIVAFVTNRSFLDSRTFDGFRKVVAEDFSDIWVVDLGGDVRANPKISGTKHNVFGIQTGVAISFLVRRRSEHGCRIHYARRPEFETASEKLAGLRGSRLDEIAMDMLHPREDCSWLFDVRNDFEYNIQLISRTVKSAKLKSQEKSIFKLYSQGLKTNRDEWVIDLSKTAVARRVQYLLGSYDAQRMSLTHVDRHIVDQHIIYDIKWTRKLKNILRRNGAIRYGADSLRRHLYRPYTMKWVYYSDALNEDLYQLGSIFPTKEPAPVIMVSGLPASKPFQCLATNELPAYDVLEKPQCIARYRYADGRRIDNITDWALDQFSTHYGPKVAITKDDIFHYVYAVLHDPVYRETYALNLRREFPRIPFYADFPRWAGWGEKLMELHIGYETVEPWELTRVEVPLRAGAPLRKGRSKDLFEAVADPSAKREADTPKVRLKADKDAGVIELDAQTQLTGVPAAAWTYRLGNRSALEWVLDQHKEKRPSDSTIRERFDTYRFADHKEEVIDLLGRVTRVSVDTMAIVEAMKAAKR